MENGKRKERSTFNFKVEKKKKTETSEEMHPTQLCSLTMFSSPKLRIEGTKKVYWKGVFLSF